MIRIPAVPATLSLLALASSRVLAQSGHDLFQQALVQERTYGDLERAIRLYEQIAEDFPDDRPLAARALVQLGSAYEMLGGTGARTAYQRVVREFADQSEQARMARSRLSALAARGGPRGGDLRTDPTYTLAFDRLRIDDTNQPAPFDLSPNGQRLVFVDRQPEVHRLGLYAWDPGAGVRQLIAADSTSGAIEGLWNPRWSPDGARIAFTARYAERDRLMGLYVFDLHASALERVDDTFGGGLCWTPDGSSVTHVGSPDGRLHTHLVIGQGRDVVLGDPLPRSTLLGGYSPDGKWLALDIRTERLGREMRDIWIQPADGGERFYVTDSPGLDASPAWGPDGSLYFVSDRGGSTNIWRLSLDAIAGGQVPPGRMRSDPLGARGRTSRLDAPRLGEPEQVTFFTRARMAYPRRAGEGGIAFVLQSVTSTIHVADAARPHESRALVRGANPQPSPDGRQLYFWGEGPSREGIFVVSRDGETSSRMTRGATPDHPLASWFHVSPDGAALAYVDDTDRGRAIFVTPVTGGTSQLMAEVERDETVVPQWSPDGAMLAFASGGGLYVMDRTGGTPREIARLRQWDGWSVRWSPDGQYLAALGWENPSGLVEVQNHVFVVSVPSGEVRRLTPDEERQYKQGLEWHPSGEAVTYMYQAPDFDGDGLRTAYLDGRPSERFIDEPRTWDYVGTWAPDGSAYYFMASRSDRPGWQLYRRDSDTGAVSEVSAGDGFSLPRWSRDGTTMAWSVERVVSQLWVMEGGP